VSSPAKPLFWSREQAATFEDASVAAAYRCRPPHPPATFAILTELLKDGPRTVLDLGCGEGLVARPLAPLVDRVDAVDVSAAMVAAGQRRPGGDHPHLKWIVGAAETAPLAPPYALATAGDSLHWMDWDAVFPRLCAALTPGGVLAIVSVGAERAPWASASLLPLIERYSTNPHRPPETDLLEHLRRRGLFAVLGRARTESVPFRQPVEDYVESWHARNGFSRQRMRPGDAAAFDAAIRALVLPFATAGGLLEQAVYGSVVWGRPREPARFRSARGPG
jgi:SAM-dependent methyltransferase